MNTEIDPRINAGQLNRKQAYTSPVKAWFKALGGFATRLTALSRGFILLLVLLLVAILSVAVVFPNRVTPASAGPEKFSAERAMVHLPIIAREPHPEGSPAQARVRDYLAGQLADMGLAVTIQQSGSLENVVARLPGFDSTGAIVILAHYDTVSYSPGAGDNGSADSALLEIMRALSAGSTPRNDIIALFDDGEEAPDIYAGTKAFVRENPLMRDVRVAISIDTAVAGPIATNEVGPNNGWLVGVLADAYNGGAWTSFSGGGDYNSTPFREAGTLVLALEDNYPFRQKHTAEDLPGIIRPASVQQMGEQTLAIVRELGSRDLVDPWGEQETFFSVPGLGLVHYPLTWSLPLSIAAGIFLLIALVLAYRSGFVAWRGLLIAFGTILLTTVFAVVIVTAIQPTLPRLFGWETLHWPDWPEVIPPNGWVAVILIDLLVLGLVLGTYLLARRWTTRSDFSLVGLLLFLLPSLALAVAEPRAAYAFLWPVLIGSLGCILAAVAGRKNTKWSLDLAALLSALPLVVLLLPFLPGVVMADGMKSLNILAAFEALMLGVFLPVVDALLVRRPKSIRADSPAEYFAGVKEGELS